MITFTEQDSVDSFEYFIEHFEFRNGNYNFHTLLGIFMKSLEQAIQEGYPYEEQDEVRTAVKKAIYHRYKNVNFTKNYTKNEILEIVF